MTLTITKHTTRQVPVEVLNMRWSNSLTEGAIACGFRCSACRGKLGARRFSVAFIRDGKVERSMRLCESCSLKAERAVGMERRAEK